MPTIAEMLAAIDARRLGRPAPPLADTRPYPWGPYIRLDGTRPSTIRKISEDLPKKRLIDVDEVEDIFDMDSSSFYSDIRRYSGERRYSNASYASYGSSSSTYDALWDARRLSEAGVRRISDTSLVLTEDTDSFIIGDRVWVGGTKPGQIAYIGETKFAPGEWAGVVLDEAVGKNDGSVAGVRYFQCEPKRGVFSRLTRLTRAQLEGGGGGGGDATAAHTSSSGTSTPPRSLASPTSSTRSSLLRRESQPAAPEPAGTAPRVGERVIVMSSQGSKAGTLRFLGPTDFAAGEWCGVELDDPLGKNDGAVAGRRYFSCPPMFGLFAPAHKVSRSPSNRRPSSCVVHRGGATPGVKRAGSRESLASTVSARSSNLAARDTIREKEAHIEQLLKERDLERAEVIRAATQADEAEHKLTTLGHEFDQYREESEAKMVDLQALLGRLQAEKGQLFGQLEDEKRKYEDLQFRFEEEAILKGDIEKTTQEQDATNASQLERIRDLESHLSAERHKNEAMEKESTKLFETEEALTQCRVDLEAVRAELAGAREALAHGAREAETRSLEASDRLAVLQRELEEALRSGAEASEVHRAEVERLRGEMEATGRRHADSLAALDLATRERDAEVEATRRQLEEAKGLLGARSDDLAARAEAAKRVEDELRAELRQSADAREALEQRIGEMTADGEAAQLSLRQKSEELEVSRSELRQKSEELEVSRSELRQKSEELEKRLSSAAESEATWRGQLEALTAKSKELTGLGEERAARLQEGAKRIEELGREVESRDSSVRELEARLAEAEERTRAERLQHERDLEGRDVRLREAEAEVQQLRVEVARLAGLVEGKECEARTEADRVASLTEELVRLQMEVGELQGRLRVATERCDRLAQQKLRLEEDVAQLAGTSSDTLGRLNAELRAREAELEAAAGAEEGLRRELEGRAKKEAELGRELEEAKGEATRLKGVQEGLRRELEGRERAEDGLRRELEEAKGEAGKLGKAEEGLRRELEGAKGEVARLGGLEEGLRKELAEAKGETTKLEREEEGLRKELAEAKGEAARLGQAEEGVRKELAEALAQGERAREEQTQQVDKLAREREGVQSLLEEKDRKLETVSKELEELKQQFATTAKTLNETDSKSTEVGKRAAELEAALASVERTVQEKSKMLDEAVAEAARLREEKGKAEKTVDEQKNVHSALSRDVELLRKEKSNAEQSLAEREAKLTSALAELSRAKEEAEGVQKSLSARESELEASKKQLAALGEEKRAMQENDLVTSTRVASEIELLKGNCDKYQKELQTNLKKAQEDSASIADLQHKLESETKSRNELLKKLNNIESENSQLAQQCKTLALSSQNDTERKAQLDALQTELKMVKQREEEFRTNSEVEKSEIERILQNTKEQLSQTANELQKQKTENSTLVTEKMQAKKYKTLLDSLELEKKQLERKMTEMKVQVEQSTANANITDPTHRSLLEEKEMAQGQIDFLNSVIVDMQRKNEELKARIEILEIGVSPAEADELNLNGCKPRTVAPRMFCDICDEFDLHETEDCPRQAMDSPPPLPPNTPHTRPRQAPDRPYCDVCEMFGHTTEECDDGETF